MQKSTLWNLRKLKILQALSIDSKFVKYVLRDYTRVNGKSATPITLDKITSLLRTKDVLDMKINTVKIACDIGSNQAFDQRSILKANFEEIDDVYSTIAWQLVLGQENDDIRSSIDTTRE